MYCSESWSRKHDLPVSFSSFSPSSSSSSSSFIPFSSFPLLLILSLSKAIALQEHDCKNEIEDWSAPARVMILWVFLYSSKYMILRIIAESNIEQCRARLCRLLQRFPKPSFCSEGIAWSVQKILKDHCICNYFMYGKFVSTGPPSAQTDCHQAKRF